MAETTANLAKITGGRLLVKNSFRNLIGQIAPMIVAVIAIPHLIHGMGTDRFGILSLAWIVIGYFSLFDFGLGRALTKLVAEKVGNGQVSELPALIWTSTILMLGLGLVGGLLVACSTHWLVTTVLKIPTSLQKESISTFYLLAVSVPIVISTSGFRGIIEAHQKFDLSNLVRIPTGILTYLGPILVLPFSNNLVYVVAVLLVCRLIGLLVHIAQCFLILPNLTKQLIFDQALVKSLIGFGGWMTVSNIISPLMVSMDRFLISGILSVSAVTYYTTPYEVATKLLIIPGALAGVLFPAFSTSYQKDVERSNLLYKRGVSIVFLLMFPVSLFLIAFAQEGMSIWLGSTFATHSFRVLQFMAVGVLINGVANIPFAFIQGAGRPDITAKMHMIELPIYLILVLTLIKTTGIEGAAIAWMVRVTLDCALLMFYANKMIGMAKKKANYSAYGLIILLICLGTEFFSSTLWVNILLFCVTFAIYLLLSWSLMIDEGLKHDLIRKIKTLRSVNG